MKSLLNVDKGRIEYLALDRVHEGDARDLLKQVEPNSVDVSVWSPPYYVGKNYESYLTFAEQGKLPVVIQTANARYLTTTLFVKYNYEVVQQENRLRSIVVAALPNAMLQAAYNPSADDTIWRTGRNAPTLGEEFRVRLVFAQLKQQMAWRVQTIPVPPDPFEWSE